MADRIKGITIEIGGDTTGLNKALSGVNKEISSTQGQLKDVERLLKLDPTNTELLRQKQKLLAEAVQGTKGKLDTLKEANKQVAESASNYDAWKEKYDPIKNQIDETKKKLGDLKEQSRNADEQLANGEISQEKYDAIQEEIKKTSSELKTLQKSAKEVSDEFGNPVAPEQYDALQREIAETEQQLKSLEDQAGKANATLQQISAAGEKFQKVGQEIEGVGKKFLPVTAAVAGVGAAAIKTTADFDESMSNVSAISGATGEDFDRLRDKAREMGAETKFSASEAADAMSYMAMAGWKTDDMLNGISGIMNLAAASGADLATTSDIVTDALTGMGYTAADAGRLADVMAAASSNANTNVEMMGETFKYVAPVCGSLGYSMEDTALAVGLMANSGIKASQAGTQLRAAITNMVKPTESMEGVMNELGIEIANEDGSMKSLDETLKILRESFAVTTEEQKAQRLATLEQQAIADGYGETLKGLSEEEKYFQLAMYAGQEQIKDMSEAQFKKQAMDKLGIKVTKKTNKAQVAQNLALALGTQAIEGLTQEQQSAYAATLFGKEAMSGMLAIINASEDDYKKLSDAIANSEGAAKDMAETTQDNLNGQLTILKSQLQEAAIAIGDALIPKIRALVAKIQQWTDWFNKLDATQKETVVKIGLLVAAIGPLLISIGKLSTGIGALMKMLPVISGGLTALSASGGPLFLTALAVGVLGGAFLAAQGNMVDYYEDARELTEAEKENKEKVEELKGAYDELSQRRQESVSVIEAQSGKEKELWKELQNITDENGKINEGYEVRAAFIVNELKNALGIEIDMVDGVIKDYKGLQQEINNLIEKKKAEATLNAYQESYTEAIVKQKGAREALFDATKNSETATQNYNDALAKENELQSEYNRLMAEYASDGTNDELRQQLYDLQDQLIMAGETTAGFKDHMIENNQTLADATAALEGYNSTIANYEGASAAIISGDQAKISESLDLLTNDFQTSETSTRESLEKQCETYKTKLAEARAAVKEGAPGITDEYVAELVRLELKSRQELAKIPEDAANSLTDATQSVKSKTGEMEISGTEFSGGLAAGILSGVGKISDTAKTLADAGVGAVEDTLEISSSSKVMEKVGEKTDAGLEGGIDGGKGDVVDAMTDVANETEFAAEDGLPQEAFSNIGKQITAGLTGGITSGKSEVVKNVQRMCTEIITSAKTQLGVHSPSTVFAYIGQMSGKGFITGWAGTVAEMQNTIHSSVSKAVTEATATFSGIEDSLLSLRDSSGSTISEVVKNAEEAQEALQKIQDGLEKTIYGQINTFDKFDGKTKMSTNELLENMQSQVDGTEQWSDNLRELAERGIDQGLLQKLAEMGPKGAGYVAVFAKMTEEELQKANDLFEQTMTLPEVTAESIMQSYQVAGSLTTQGFKDGITEEIPQVIGEVSKMSQGITATIEALIPLADTWSEDMMDGFIQGIKEKTSEVEAACRSVAGTVSDYLHFTRPEKGPLRYYEEWMPHMMQGLEEGIRGNMWRVTDQMAALAGSMDVMTMNMTGGGEQNIGVIQQVISLLETYLPDIASQKYVMMDGKALVGKTVGQMDRKLGQVQALKERIG
ncbi:phage tail tape measure protein [Enterocloster clostridioformis]|uniref:phage tail tape measure protein n=1 Tax=Enterocloster clostridioformis TaxID=1531 RepID=UPI0032C1AE68